MMRHGAFLALLGCLLAAAPAGARVGPPLTDSDVWRTDSREFLIPFRVDPGRGDEINEVRLYVSRDRGKTWVKAGTQSPSSDGFPFTAPEDGLYWFSVQMVTSDGRPHPADTAALSPGLKLRCRKRSPADGSILREVKDELRYLRQRILEMEKRLAEAEKQKEE
jgi:hypothetical protein